MYLSFGFSYSQSPDVKAIYPKDKTKKKHFFTRADKYIRIKNYTVKIDLIPLYYPHTNLSVELNKDEVKSFGFSFGNMHSRNPDLKGLLNWSEHGKFKYINGFSTSLYYRHYESSKGTGRGFYVSPFIKSSYYSTRIRDEDNASFELRPYYNSFGAGCSIGCQYITTNGFTLDINFIGISYHYFRFGLDMKGYSNLQQVGASYGHFYDRLSLNRSKKMRFEEVNDTAKGVLHRFMPGLRSMISIGYSF